MMALYKKKELTPEKLRQKEEREKKAFDVGVKIGEHIHLDKNVERINRYGQKHPKRISILIMVTMTFMIIIPIIVHFSEKRTPQKDVINEVLKSHTEKPIGDARLIMESNREQLDKTYKEMDQTDRELRSIMSLKHKTRGDSIAISHKIWQLKNLSHIIDLNSYAKN